MGGRAGRGAMQGWLMDGCRGGLQLELAWKAATCEHALYFLRGTANPTARLSRSCRLPAWSLTRARQVRNPDRGGVDPHIAARTNRNTNGSLVLGQVQDCFGEWPADVRAVCWWRVARKPACLSADVWRVAASSQPCAKHGCHCLVATWSQPWSIISALRNPPHKPPQAAASPLSTPCTATWRSCASGTECSASERQAVCMPGYGRVAAQLPRSGERLHCQAVVQYAAHVC